MKRVLAALSSLALVILSWGVALPARAADSAPITRYHVDVNLTENGVAEVTIDMTMDFSTVSGRGPFLTLPTRQDDGQNPKEQFVFTYSDFAVSSSTGARTDLHLEKEFDYLGLRIGNKDVVNYEPQQYTIRYNLAGIVVAEHPKSGMDEFSWDVIGASWESTFEDISVTITGPADVSRAACFYGPEVTTPCEASHTGRSSTHTLSALPRKTAMQVVAGFPAGTFIGVQQTKSRKVTTANMFELTPATGAATGVGVVAAVAGLLRVRRRHARDEVYLGLTPGLTPANPQEAPVGTASGKVPVTVQFHPPKGALPGELGTLMDATADNIDVSASIIDLAVRGYLRIESDGRKDFTFIRLDNPPNDQLSGYESTLLSNLFQGSQVRHSSQLRQAQFANVLPNARSGLYSSVVGKKWFTSHPRMAQILPIVLGLLIGGFGFVVAIFAGGAFGWGLIGLPIMLFGGGLIVMSGKFRKRTALGSAMLAQAKGFELYLATAEKETLRFEEGQDVFSRYLPYAMIFGLADRWSRLFAQLGQQGIYQANTSWYTGADLMHGFYFSQALANLTASMSDAFTTAGIQKISSSAGSLGSSTGSSSGFSGFSGGGGFGGGGGGSW